MTPIGPVQTFEAMLEEQTGYLKEIFATPPEEFVEELKSFRNTSTFVVYISKKTAEGKYKEKIHKITNLSLNLGEQGWEGCQRYLVIGIEDLYRDIRNKEYDNTHNSEITIARLIRLTQKRGKIALGQFYSIYASNPEALCVIPPLSKENFPLSEAHLEHPFSYDALPKVVHLLALQTCALLFTPPIKQPIEPIASLSLDHHIADASKNSHLTESFTNEVIYKDFPHLTAPDGLRHVCSKQLWRSEMREQSTEGDAVCLTLQPTQSNESLSSVQSEEMRARIQLFDTNPTQADEATQLKMKEAYEQAVFEFVNKCFWMDCRFTLGESRVIDLLRTKRRCKFLLTRCSRRDPFVSYDREAYAGLGKVGRGRLSNGYSIIYGLRSPKVKEFGLTKAELKHVVASDDEAKAIGALFALKTRQILFNRETTL